MREKSSVNYLEEFWIVLTFLLLCAHVNVYETCPCWNNWLLKWEHLGKNSKWKSKLKEHVRMENYIYIYIYVSDARECHLLTGRCECRPHTGWGDRIKHSVFSFLSVLTISDVKFWADSFFLFLSFFLFMLIQNLKTWFTLHLLLKFNLLRQTDHCDLRTAPVSSGWKPLLKTTTKTEKQRKGLWVRLMIKTLGGGMLLRFCQEK